MRLAPAASPPAASLLAACLLAAWLIAAWPAAASEPRTVKPLVPGVTWTHIVRTRGPLRVNVLTIDRGKLRGRLRAVLSNGRTAGVERVSSMASRLRAVAGVNGGFFAADGNPVGVLGVGGRLVSEPVGRRPALLVPKARSSPPSVAELRFAGKVRVGSGRRLLDGVDRTPGRVPGCGGRGGDRPTEKPNEFLTCTDPSELVLFDRSWAARTPYGGTEVVLRRGVAGAPRGSGGTRVPRGGLVLWGSGDAARFLRGVEAGSRPAVDLTLRSGRRSFDPADYEAIVGGDPRILRPAAGTAFAGAAAGRNPRTLAGVRSNGALVLAVVDGRRPGWSVGVSLLEAARLMRSLGAREAVSLDSGGSSVMAVGRRVVSRPSDPAGERAVSDGLFVLP